MVLDRLFHTGNEGIAVHWSGRGFVDPVELGRELRNGWEKTVEGWDFRLDASTGALLFLPKKNLVVNSGLQRSLDRLFAINSTPAALTRVGVDNSASNPTATTDQSGANTKTLLTFDSTPTRSSQVVTSLRTFTNSNVNFAMKRLFLSAHTADITNSTSADTAGTMYSCTNAFTIDLTAFSSWSLTFSATVTGTGS